MTATKEYMAAYRAANREKFREYAKRHVAKHGRRKLSEEEKEKQKDYMRDYQQANKEHLRAMKKLQIAKNPIYAASTLKGLKKTSALDLIGCSIDEFKIFIEEKFKENMSWNNYGEWELDHIKPLALFNLVDMKEQKLAFHFTNFQPLWKQDNRAKRDYYEY